MRQNEDLKESRLSVFVFALITILLLAFIAYRFGMIEKGRVKNVNLDELETKLSQLQSEHEALASEEEQLIQARASMVDELLHKDLNRLYLPKEEMEKAKAALYLSGLERERGFGLRITLQDAADITYNTDEHDKIIHDAQLRYVVERLKTDRPLAMAVNGERIVSTSKIVCNGPTVLVNHKLKPAPFVIEAIYSGEEAAEIVYADLQKDQYLADLKTKGIRIEIEMEHMTIEPYDASESDELRSSDTE